MRILAQLSFLLAISGVVLAQDAEVIFVGLPSIKVSEGGTERQAQDIQGDKAHGARVSITKIGAIYYWASRDNRELMLVDGGGAYLTFIAINGSGYIRVTKNAWKPMVSKLGGPESTFDYVEHLVVGLHSITYWGRRSEF